MFSKIYLTTLVGQNTNTMKKLFTIIDFERSQEDNLLTVMLNCNNCFILLSDFEKWLERTDRLLWENNYSDESGDHCQENGAYSLSQYWDMGYKFITNDIYDFIVIHYTTPFKDIPKTLTNITNTYARKSTPHLV